MANVPRVPGVPLLPAYAALPFVLLTQDIPFSGSSFSAPQWGIFLDGFPALPSARSVLSVHYKQDWVIADYPVEGGGFQSYDKVQLPFDLRVRIVSGGTGDARAELLAALDEVANSLDLYDIVTPEKTYLSVNVSHVDYDRSAASGVGVIPIDVWFAEIRVTATASFTNTQQPAEAGQQSLGAVQPQRGTTGNITIQPTTVR